MKYYIMLTPGISDIGGAQMYTRNKLLYLINSNYNVKIFHSGAGNGLIMIEELLSFKENGDYHILYPAYLFNERIKENVTSLICKDVPADITELIIESHSIACATWGELVAKKIEAKHIVYLLSEYSSIRNRDMYDFFRFKLQRNELAGITNKTIRVLFGKWQILADNDSTSLSASCTNVVEDLPYSMLSKIPKSDFTIGSIGRLNKLYLNDVIDDIVDFVKTMPDQKFTILFIGGEPRESNNKKAIEQKFQSIKNITPFFTGYLYPIPRELILKPDVFISSAGSCFVSSSLGVPTISIDSNDHKPIGIIGETTCNALFRDNEIGKSLQELLGDVLINKIYKKKSSNDTKQMHFDFSTHLQFVKNSSSSREFFPFMSIHFSLRDWIEKFSLYILGDKQLRKISMKLWPIWDRIKKSKLYF